MGTKPGGQARKDTDDVVYSRISISKDLPSFEKPMSTADTKASRFIISIEFRLEWRRSQVRQVPETPGGWVVDNSLGQAGRAPSPQLWVGTHGQGQNPFCSPAETVNKKAHGEGNQRASHREDGHGQGPGAWSVWRRDGLPIALHPRLL